MTDELKDLDFRPPSRRGRPRKVVLTPRIDTFRSEPVEQAEEFAGLTGTNCALDCNAERCVISGRIYCAHPYKGGLQGVDNANAECLDRRDRALKMLRHAAVERRSA